MSRDDIQKICLEEEPRERAYYAKLAQAAEGDPDAMDDIEEVLERGRRLFAEEMMRITERVSVATIRYMLEAPLGSACVAILAQESKWAKAGWPGVVDALDAFIEAGDSSPGEREKGITLFGLVALSGGFSKNDQERLWSMLDDRDVWWGSLAAGILVCCALDEDSFEILWKKITAEHGLEKLSRALPWREFARHSWKPGVKNVVAFDKGIELWRIKPEDVPWFMYVMMGWHEYRGMDVASFLSFFTDRALNELLLVCAKEQNMGAAAKILFSQLVLDGDLVLADEVRGWAKELFQGMSAAEKAKLLSVAQGEVRNFLVGALGAKPLMEKAEQRSSATR